MYYKSHIVSRVGHLHLNEGHCPLNVSRLSTSIRQTLEKLCNKLIYLTELKTILNFLQHHYTEVFSCYISYYISRTLFVFYVDVPSNNIKLGLYDKLTQMLPRGPK